MGEGIDAERMEFLVLDGMYIGHETLSSMDR